MGPLMEHFDKYDEYKFYVDNTQHLDDRRAALTQMFLGVNTAIFALVGFLLKDAGLQGQLLAFMIAPLFIVGILVCLLWISSINRFRRLISWRYDQLIAMERALPESHQMYLKEWELMFAKEARKKILGLSLLDWLPRVLLAMWLVYGGAFLVARSLV